MCIVYQAWDTRLQRNVAVKRLEPPLNEDPRTRARFDREGRALAQLSHPNLVTLIDRGSTENEDYLVFEYIEGRSLKELTREGPLSVSEAGKIAGSEGYKRQAFLGLTELNRCLYAEYAGEGEATYQGFVVLPPEGSSPAAAWDALAGAWESAEHDGRTILYTEIPYRGLAGVVQTGRSLVGVAGAADRDELLRRLGLVR